MRGISLALCALAIGMPALAKGFDVQGQVTLNQPTEDLKTALDDKTGVGIGIHWMKRHGFQHTSRTRLDWNVWGQGPSVLGVKSTVSNIHLAFDHLYHFQDRDKGVYLVGGLGGVRWKTEREAITGTSKFTTTKLGVTAGAGYQFNRNLGAEGRVLVSGVDKAFDSTVVQAAFVFKF